MKFQYSPQMSLCRETIGGVTKMLVVFSGHLLECKVLEMGDLGLLSLLSPSLIYNCVIFQLQVWDTAGQERFRTITQSYYRSANAVVITYDITKKDTFKNVVRWTEDVKKYAPPNVLKLLVGNKTDISESREVSIEEARACAAHYGMIDVLEASAKVGTKENGF